MMQRLAYLILALLALHAHAQLNPTNGTESYFLTPHGLGRTPEVSLALDKIEGQLKVKRTTYSVGGVTYIMDNVVVGTAYIDAKQVIDVSKTDTVRVAGGRIEFTYKFNYTKIVDRNNITGYGYGSVLTDNITYYKEFAFCGGFLCWVLPKINGISNVSIVENRMRIKRLEPFNQTDLDNLENMLDRATAIDPSNIETQLLQIFNAIFPLGLNDSLNHETFGEKINYTYYSNSHGELKMTIEHQLQGFGINPETGYHVIFITKIADWNETLCDNITVQTKPSPIDIYGGSQNFHLNCLYESVVSYLHANGWLDTVLNEDWESDSFQFYAGDLFDLINNLHLSFSPRTILDGRCVALKAGLRFFASREFEANAYTLDVTYNCSLKGSNRNASETQILKFQAKTKIFIKVEATKKTLNFQIILAEIQTLIFEPVGNFFVNNINLAMFKANSLLKKLSKTYTFGTGFPTIERESPQARVDRDQVLYYDSSHISRS